MAKTKLNKTQTIISIVVAVIMLIVIASGVYCVATKQNPVDAAKSVFTANDEQIIGKWQSQKSPGLSAFVFFDDGTYDSYISTVVFSGTYEINGNKITLTNPKTAKEIVYSFSVTEKELSLKVIEEDGEKSENKDETKYDRVNELNQKTLTDMIGELAGDKNAANEE